MILLKKIQFFESLIIPNVYVIMHTYTFVCVRYFSHIFYYIFLFIVQESTDKIKENDKKNSRIYKCNVFIDTAIVDS